MESMDLNGQNHTTGNLYKRNYRNLPHNWFYWLMNAQYCTILSLDGCKNQEPKKKYCFKMRCKSKNTMRVECVQQSCRIWRHLVNGNGAGKLLRLVHELSH